MAAVTPERSFLSIRRGHHRTPITFGHNSANHQCARRRPSHRARWQPYGADHRCPRAGTGDHDQPGSDGLTTPTRLPTPAGDMSAASGPSPPTRMRWSQSLQFLAAASARVPHAGPLATRQRRRDIHDHRRWSRSAGLAARRQPGNARVQVQSVHQVPLQWLLRKALHRLEVVVQIGVEHENDMSVGRPVPSRRRRAGTPQPSPRESPCRT